VAGWRSSVPPLEVREMEVGSASKMVILRSIAVGDLDVDVDGVVRRRASMSPAGPAPVMAILKGGRFWAILKIFDIFVCLS